MPNKIRIFLIFILLSHLPLSFGDSLELPKNNPVPGGLVVVELDGDFTEPPKAHFGNKQLFVKSTGARWIAVIGLPINILPGKYLVTYQRKSEEKFSTSFRIHPLPATKGQRTVHLPENLDSLSFNTTDDDSHKYVSDDSNAAENINPKFSLQQAINSGSYIPYGKIIQKQLASKLIEHPWITYITKTDELVRSPGFAMVDQIYLSENAGIFVVLNHGGGMRSILSYLDDVIVKPGDRLKPGDAIGTSLTITNLAIGRVDWKLILNQYYIDPLQFTPSA